MTDTERFRYFKLPLPTRLVLTAGLYALGLLVQIGFAPGFFFGTALIVLGWFPIKLRRFDNKPKDQGKEEWRPVGSAEVDTLIDTMKRSKELKRKLGGRGGAKFLFVVLVLAVMFFAIKSDSTRGLLLGFDLFLLAFPVVFLGGANVYIPTTLDMKLRAFMPVLTAEPRPEGVVGVPYFRFDQDENGLDIPEDLRYMLELKRAPEDFVGVQFQAAVNNGPNGAVPYLYAVVLTRGASGPGRRAIENLKARGFVVEAGGDDKYGTVVVRQTTDSGGYYTSPDDVRKLYEVMLAVIERVRQAA